MCSELKSGLRTAFQRGGKLRWDSACGSPPEGHSCVSQKAFPVPWSHPCSAGHSQQASPGTCDAGIFAWGRCPQTAGGSQLLPASFLTTRGPSWTIFRMQYLEDCNVHWFWWCLWPLSGSSFFVSCCLEKAGFKKSQQQTWELDNRATGGKVVSLEENNLTRQWFILVELRGSPLFLI